MKRISWTVFVAVILPFASLAQDQSKYQCSHGDLQRRVEIVYETGVTVPCEVHYYKDTEVPGERQVLWRALNQEGYCEEKTRDFVAKLSAWGWQCDQQGNGAASDEAAEPDAVDDTEMLAPSEEPEETEDS